MDFITTYFFVFVILIIAGMIGAIKSHVAIFIAEAVVFVISFVFRDALGLMNTTNALIFVLTFAVLLVAGAIGYSLFKNSESIVFPQIFTFGLCFIFLPYIFGVT